VFVVETIEEMQKLLLSWEEELMWREEALVVREEKVKISEKSLTQVSATLDTEWAQAEATQQEYLDKIQARTDHGNQVLHLDRMLGKRKEELDRKEKDLELRIVALVEAQARGLNPRDNHDERMELIELSGIL
jgi:predicted ribosome quality control (RQC) complex YloA/Tae2 family protein